MKSEARIWLEFARKDLTSAEALAKIGEYENALYHLQQASEKSLKAVIIHFNISTFIRTHNIEKLISVLTSQSVDVPKEIKESYKLTKYAFTTRYPDDYIPVSSEEYEEACEIAVKVYEWAKGIIEESALE